jgi:hypothetical protein
VAYRGELEERRRGQGGAEEREGDEADGDVVRKAKKRTRDEIKAVSKYHGVRFFERQKAARRLKKLKNRLMGIGGDGDDQGDAQGESDGDGDGNDTNADPSAQKALQQSLREAQVDLNYTIYSPLAEKYVSLFVEGDGQRVRDAQSGEARRAGKPKWWFVVERAMAEDKLEELREGLWPADLAERRRERAERAEREKRAERRAEKERSKAEAEEQEKAQKGPQKTSDSSRHVDASKDAAAAARKRARNEPEPRNRRERRRLESRGPDEEGGPEMGGEARAVRGVAARGRRRRRQRRWVLRVSGRQRASWRFRVRGREVGEWDFFLWRRASSLRRALCSVLATGAL